MACQENSLCYSLERPKLGGLFIINNIPGKADEVQKLESTFKSLDFEVQVKESLSCTDMECALQSFVVRTIAFQDPFSSDPRSDLDF